MRGIVVILIDSYLKNEREHAFHECINSKMNIKARLELAYYEVAVQ